MPSLQESLAALRRLLASRSSSKSVPAESPSQEPHSSLSFPVSLPKPSPQPSEVTSPVTLSEPPSHPSQPLRESDYQPVPPTPSRSRSVWPEWVQDHGDTLHDPLCVDRMWEYAVRRGWQTGTQANRLQWHTLAVSTYRRWLLGDISSPIGAFTRSARNRSWWGTDEDEQQARRNLKALG